ncbi:uncharacterized protein EDB91DRAFT_1082399 [Suillus paluster]|uniref:uncharacterized protein n=1 Tax=Suillus paluster TaxID=48578 RepID=UPI001B87D97F|nr:uncharacterized protein EDB91DRAFT_1082399 [Suillus paluster]KAG1739465.1 hypothetical protein EDB91DRAFT_1082399 [Suillus paluster]
MNWSNSDFNHAPTVDGTRRLLEAISHPAEPAGVTDMSDRWISALIAMLAHGFHNDNNHLKDDKGFHPLMIEHYTSTSFDGLSSDDKQGASRERSTHLVRLRRLIYDLCTVLDRLSGGTTLCLHHPGATAPLTDIHAEDLSASLYINPKLLAQQTECHQTIAQITQLFIEGCALPVAQSFRKAQLAHGWRQDLQMVLIPPDFDILGRPVGCLDHIFATRATTDSMVPFSSISGRLSSVRWINQQVPLSSRTSLVARDSTDNLVNQLCTTSPSDAIASLPAFTLDASTQSSATPSQGMTIARMHQIQATPSAMPSRANSYSLNVAHTLSNTSHLSMHEVSVTPVSTPATSRITNQEPGGFSSYPSPRRPLRSFGPVNSTHPPGTWRAKRADEDAAVDEVLTYIDEQATELAQQFGRSRRHYLEKNFISSAMQRKQHNKTSSWSVYLHFKGRNFNADKEVGQRSNIRALARDTEEYHQLTLEQHSEMVEEFNKIKSSRQSKPPNVTTHTRLAEVNHSFAAMVSEAEALKEHFLLGSQHETVFSMTYTDRKLTAKSSIQNGLNQSLVDVTEDQNATLEFVRYERMVQAHLVKIVGWISKDEAIKRMERIDAGEDLSPNKVDTEPYESDNNNNRDSNNNDGDRDGDNSNDIDIDNSNGNDGDGDNSNSNSNSNSNNRDRDNSRDRDNNGSVGNTSASIPTFNLAPVTNHKRGAPEPSTDGAPAKRRRKMTEKAMYAARKAQKWNRRGKGAKSVAVVDSSDSDENEWEDL